jgi:hypothetical protein
MYAELLLLVALLLLLFYWRVTRNFGKWKELGIPHVPGHFPFGSHKAGQEAIYFRKIRHIDVNAKCRHLKKLTCKGTLRHVFIRVYRLVLANFLRAFSQIGIFNPALWSVLSPVAPLPFSLVQLSPSALPLPVLIHILHTCIQCVGGGGVWGSRPQADKHLPQSPLQVNFFRWRHFALVSIKLIRPWRNRH